MAEIDAKAPTLEKLTIPNGGSSAVGRIGPNRTLVGVLVPSGTEGNLLLFDVSLDGAATWWELRDNANQLVAFDFGDPELAGVQGTAQPVDQALSLAWTHIRVKTATNGTPPTLQNQTGASDIYLIYG